MDQSVGPVVMMRAEIAAMVYVRKWIAHLAHTCPKSTQTLTDVKTQTVWLVIRKTDNILAPKMELYAPADVMDLTIQHRLVVPVVRISRHASYQFCIFSSK